MNLQRELAELEELVDQLLRGIQEVLQSGEILSDEFQGMIAQELEVAMARIDEIQSEISAFENKSPEPPEGPASPIAGNAPMPQGADLLWILSGGQPEAFINYARTFPDQGLNALANNPQALAQVLQQLERQMPQGERGSADGIDRAPLDSSNIYGFQYDPKNGSLKVRFQSGDVYGYQGVPKQIYQIFANGAVPAKTSGKNEHGQWWQGKNPSLGAAFSALIKQGGYPYQKLT
jgi:hypothetical protein